jgi:hypothetical protein
MTLSIDIGWTYVAFAYVRDFTVVYGIHNFSVSDVVLTTQSINGLLNQFEINQVLVEKQVPQNTKCMKIMYLIVGLYGGRGVPVEVVDARQKFEALGVEWTRVNKAHKQLSVDLAKAWLEESGVEDFSSRKLHEYAKQDDISDAINQIRGWLIRLTPT